MKASASILMCMLLSIITSEAQETTKKQALIIIDIQDFYFPGGDMALYKPELAAENAALLLADFRENKNLIVHIRHIYEPGGAIHKSVTPLENEKVISKNEINAFLNTNLLDYLHENKIEKLLLCGMQTHMCLEAATRAAHDFGFECMVIGDACATRDLKFNDQIVKAMDVHNATLSTLNGTYAKVISTSDYLKNK